MRKLLVIVLLLSSFSSMAQFEEPTEPKDTSNYFPKLALKFIPSHLVGRWGGFMFGLEHSVNKKMSLDYRYGIVIGQDVLGSEEDIYFGDKSGFKSSVTLKLATDDFAIGKPYFGFEAFYNSYDFNRTRTFELTCGTGCSFFKQETFPVDQIEYGLRIGLGTAIPVSEIFLIEFYAAIGFEIYDISSNTTYSEAEVINAYGTNFPDNENSYRMAGDLAIKFTFLILK